MITLPIKNEAVLFTNQELADMQDELSFEFLSQNILVKKNKKILNNAVRSFLSNKKEIIKVKFVFTSLISKEEYYVFQITYMDFIDE